MKTVEKLFLLFYFGCALFGVAMGTTDYINSTNTNFFLQLIGNTGIPMPNLMWNTNIQNSILNVLGFLVFPAFAVLFVGLMGYLIGVKKGLVDIVSLIALFVSCGLIISVAWDAVYAFLVLTTWHYAVITEYVIWLPFYSPTGVGGIIFTWQFSVYFIFIRLVLSLILFSFSLSRSTIQKSEWGNIYVKRL